MIIQSADLTDRESDLMKQIRFEGSGPGLDHHFWIQNGALAAELFTMLEARGGIPKIRLAYFCDPEHGSRGKSLKQRFEDNGTKGNAILSHPSFLKHLKYFLHGPNLPAAAIEEYCRMVDACGSVTSGDVETLRKTARSITRKYSLQPHEAADEFYKLALECGLGSMYADPVRRAVMEVKTKR